MTRRHHSTTIADLIIVTVPEGACQIEADYVKVDDVTVFSYIDPSMHYHAATFNNISGNWKILTDEDAWMVVDSVHKKHFNEHFYYKNYGTGMDFTTPTESLNTLKTFLNVKLNEIVLFKSLK